MLSLPKGLNEHYGRNVDKMPELLEAGEAPAYAARLMQARLRQGEEFPDLWNNYFDSSDLVIYPKRNNKELYVLLTIDNQGKITHNGRKALSLIKPNNLASNSGAIVGQLRDLGRKGLIKVLRSKIKTDEYLTQQQILDQQIWRILARHPDEVPAEFAEDKNLLKEYANEVQKRTRNTKNMALYIGDSLKTTLRAWYVDGLEGRSYADGRYHLDYDGGRFLGIAPEALSAPGRGASNRKTYTMANIQTAKAQLDAVEKVLRPELTKDIRSLVSKL